MSFMYEEELESLRNIIKKTIFQTKLRPAKEEDLDYLQSVHYPSEIINFYQYAEPSDYIDHNGVTLRPIKELKEENEEAVPSYVVFSFGFRCIATTLYGDVYCVDINETEGHMPGAVFLVSHDEIDEDVDETEIELGMIKVADGFREFLSLYITGKLIRNYHEIKS